MTGREAAANRSREEKLEKECIRLAKEVSRLRDRDNRWTYSFSHVARSLTWRLVMRGNELLARVLRVKGAPPAWQLMQGILEERDDRAEELGHKSASASGGWMHAEGATSAAGLTVAAPGQTLLSAPQTPKPPKWLRVARLDSALEFPVGLCNVLTETPIMDSWKHCEAGTGLVLFTERAPNEEETETIRLSADSLGGALRIAALNAVDVGISLSEYASTPPDSLGDDPLDLTLHRWWHDLIQELRIALEPVPFSARAYLLDNPDVIEAIDHGDFESAEDHWETIGRAAFLNGYRTYNVRHDPPSLGLGEVTEDLRAEAAREIGAWEHAPTFSILMPVYKVPVEWLRAALDSVMAQLYESWTLCIVDDASDDAAITEFLKSLDDPRIEILTLEHNQGIAGATQAALEMASGDYIALLDHDDEITPRRILVDGESNR
ncbi:MAG: glycosyltransferase [Pseudomonadota bacterium]